MDSRDQQSLFWYALQVRPRFEKVVARNLRAKGFDEFLPLFRRRRQWSDRMKVIELPLFPGYVFSRFDIDDRLPILLVPGVRAVVAAGRSAAPVDEREIEGLRSVVTSGLDYQPWPFVRAGEPVLVENGALAGVEGIVKTVKNEDRLIISISLLRRSVAVEIDRENVKPLRQSGAVAAGGKNRRQFVG